MSDWLRSDGEDVVLSLHIQPGAKKTELAGMHGGALKIRLAAPPVDGRANDCLIAYLADRLAVAKRRVELVSGAGSREKRVRVAGIDADTARTRLAAQFQEPS
ncbi:hypothetical protein GALL_254760 [mine drainage metagenome]|uniref:Protein containing DUF167 n=1 Tax=mine drainage metagenome TaxID=410659 RepID=A0A1J5RKR8_9ZZZZ